MTPRHILRLILFFTVLASTMFGYSSQTPLVWAQEAQSGPSGLLEPTRPKWKFERRQEDWSVLNNVPGSQLTDPWDSVKFIPLNGDGSIYMSLGGHLRGRVEHSDNFAFGAPATNDDTFYLGRLKVHTDIHVTPFLRVFLEGKSALSEDRDLPGGRRTIDVDTIALQQAFFDLRIPLGHTAALTIRPGRQEFLLGKQRLVSPLPWGNTLRTWDGVTGILTVGAWDIRAFWSEFVPVQKYTRNTSKSSNTLFGIYSSGKVFTNQLALDLYWLGIERDNKTFNGTSGNESRQTVGGRFGGKIPHTNVDVEIEGADQFGSVGNADIQAFMFSSVLGYRFANWKGQPRVWAGFDYASGDNGAGGDVHTFNQLFPLGHAYLGYIDIIGRQNIMDVSQGLSLKPFQIIPLNPLKKLTFNVNHHLFFLANQADALYNAGSGVVRAGSSGTSKVVGAELDLTAKLTIGRHLATLVGYSHFFAGRFLEQSGANQDINFSYAQVQYTF